MQDIVTITVIWTGSIIAGVIVGREKGRLTEAVVLTVLTGLLGVILIAVLPPNVNKGRGSASNKPLLTKSLPITKIDHPRGYMTCGCAVLCAIGLLPLFAGIGFGGGGAYTFTDVFFFGSILALPAAVLTYSGLTYFGVDEGHAKTWAIVVYLFMVGATWMFLHYIAVEGRRLRGW